MKTQTKHLLVVDDDPVFRMMLSQAAVRKGLHVTACASIRELREMTNVPSFDVIVLDYFLDDFKTYLKGTDIAQGLGATPVILVSSSEQCVEDSDAWPNSIRRFVHKKWGVDNIVDVVDSIRPIPLQSPS